MLTSRRRRTRVGRTDVAVIAASHHAGARAARLRGRAQARAHAGRPRARSRLAGACDAGRRRARRVLAAARRVAVSHGRRAAERVVRREHAVARPTAVPRAADVVVADHRRTGTACPVQALLDAVARIAVVAACARISGITRIHRSDISVRACVTRPIEQDTAEFGIADERVSACADDGNDRASSLDASGGRTGLARRGTVRRERAAAAPALTPGQCRLIGASRGLALAAHAALAARRAGGIDALAVTAEQVDLDRVDPGDEAVRFELHRQRFPGGANQRDRVVVALGCRLEGDSNDLLREDVTEVERGRTALHDAVHLHRHVGEVRAGSIGRDDVEVHQRRLLAPAHQQREHDDGQGAHENRLHGSCAGCKPRAGDTCAPIRGAVTSATMDSDDRSP